MEDKLSERSWKDILPKTFSWLEQLSIGIVDKPSPNSASIILVKKEKKKTTTKDFSIDAPQLDESVRDALKNSLKRINWSPSNGPTVIESNSQIFVVTPAYSEAMRSERVGRQAGLDCASRIKKSAFNQITVISGEKVHGLDIFDGLVQGLYQSETFKKEPPTENDSLPKVELLANGVSQERIKQTLAMAKATIITRILEDAPPNWLHSERFAAIAEEVSRDSNIKCMIGGSKEIRELGMGSFFSVSKGSPIEPKLITMEIKGKNPDKWVALIGKGLTFDSGGTNLKPSAGMAEMKYDMCGGASILGAAYYLAHVQPETNVVCIIGAVENILSGWANKPGDVVTSMSGKTIEILNTDAEGRLVLADLLHYAAEKYKPELMINTATLTGAVLMSLGSVGAALMSNKQSAAKFVLDVAEKQGEPMWQLPLWEEFNKELKSDIADLKNIANSSVKAGSIIAGAFLKEFVGHTPWVHLDIAGTGWNCKATGYPTSGGSGFGLRTLTGSCQLINELDS